MKSKFIIMLVLLCMYYDIHMYMFEKIKNNYMHMSVYVYRCVCVHVYACICVCMYMCTYVYVCTDVCVSAYRYLCWAYTLNI